METSIDFKIPLVIQGLFSLFVCFLSTFSSDTSRSISPVAVSKKFLQDRSGSICSNNTCFSQSIIQTLVTNVSSSKDFQLF